MRTAGCSGDSSHPSCLARDRWRGHRRGADGRAGAHQRSARPAPRGRPRRGRDLIRLGAGPARRDEPRPARGASRRRHAARRRALACHPGMDAGRRGSRRAHRRDAGTGGRTDRRLAVHGRRRRRPDHQRARAGPGRLQPGRSRGRHGAAPDRRRARPGSRRHRAAGGRTGRRAGVDAAAAAGGRCRHRLAAGDQRPPAPARRDAADGDPGQLRRRDGAADRCRRDPRGRHRRSGSASPRSPGSTWAG